MNDATLISSSVPTFGLRRDAHGRLVVTLPDGSEHEAVVPVRAFPVAAPLEGLSLVGQNGHELIWVARMDHLPADVRSLLEDELAVREFVPTIQQIHRVSSFSTPSRWDVETDRGPARLTLKAEEDIRRLGTRTSLLIADADGVQFKVPDVTELDRASRKLLERFL